MDGPAKSILCPRLKTPAISSGASSGMLSHTSGSGSISGRLSFNSSIHAFQSSHDGRPVLVATKYCFCPLRSIPGSLDSRDGFLLALSICSPFFWQTVWRKFTRSRYSVKSAASILTIACMDFDPECTNATHGNSNRSYMAACFSGAIESDSISAYRKDVTFLSLIPSPSKGFGRIHAPAAGS